MPIEKGVGGREREWLIGQLRQKMIAWLLLAIDLSFVCANRKWQRKEGKRVVDWLTVPKNICSAVAGKGSLFCLCQQRRAQEGWKESSQLADYTKNDHSVVAGD